jgi:hypothetical protein
MKNPEFITSTRLREEELGDCKSMLSEEIFKRKVFSAAPMPVKYRLALHIQQFFRLRL